jgi:hypothetical protein
MGNHFAKGDNVAWTSIAHEHGTGSIARKTAIQSRDRDARYGTVTGPSKTYDNAYTVRFGKDDERDLTFEELVKVENDA